MLFSLILSFISGLDLPATTVSNIRNVAQTNIRSSRNERSYVLPENADSIPPTPLAITSLHSEFAIVSSIRGRYDIDENFIRITIDSALIHSQSKSELDLKYLGKRKIVSISFGLEYATSSGSWDIERKGREIAINKELMPGENYLMPTFTCRIRTTSLERISTYKIIATITAITYDGNRETSGVSYVHDTKFVVSPPVKTRYI